MQTYNKANNKFFFSVSFGLISFLFDPFGRANVGLQLEISNLVWRNNHNMCAYNWSWQRFCDFDGHFGFLHLYKDAQGFTSDIHQI